MTMSPVYLNPIPNSFPVEEQQQLHLFLSPHQASTNTLSGPTTLFNSAQDQRGKETGGSHQLVDDQVDQYISCSRFSDQSLFSTSPSINIDDASNSQKVWSCKREEGDSEGSSSGDGSVKWMPSKMRLMQKMMNSSCSSSAESEKPLKFTPRFQDQRYHTNEEFMNSPSNRNNYSSTNIRICSDCNTTTTPLWRSGPKGPKSLCNACGIRQRKARRAMAAAAAAANGTAHVTIEPPCTKIIKAHKEKKSRTGHIAQCKKLCKTPADPPQSQKKLCFKNLALSLSKNSSALQRVLPQDVEEAAILLMELSCGFFQS